jgi:hypothetical protein
MPAVPPHIIEPIWEQFAALLPERDVDHPLGCHRTRVPDRVTFEKLVQVLVFGCAYWRISDEECSATTLRVDVKGIPLGIVSAPAKRHDSPLSAGTLDATRALDLLPEGTSILLDRGYDSEATREKLRARGLIAEISKKGKPAPLAATGRWIVERTNSWQAKLAHKKLVWCTERRGRVIDFWIAFSNVIIIVRRLIQEAWTRYP